MDISTAVKAINDAFAPAQEERKPRTLRPEVPQSTHYVRAIPGAGGPLDLTKNGDVVIRKGWPGFSLTARRPWVLKAERRAANKAARISRRKNRS